LDVCYRCGRRLYSPDRCPVCGLTFCEEHLPPEKHDCLVVAERRGKKRSRIFSMLEFTAFLVILALVWWFVNHR
jgi:hypothetical protein